MGNSVNNNLTLQTFLRWVMGLAIAVAVGAVLWYFREVVVYILVSAVLAIIGRPLVRLLCKVKVKRFSLPRWLAAAITLVLLWLVIGGLLSLIIPLVAGKVYELSSLDLRSALEGVEQPLERLQNYISTIFVLPETHFSISDIIVSTLRRFLNYDTVNSVVSSIINMGMSAVIVLFSVSFITFFFLKEDGLFSTMVSAVFPDKYVENVHRAIEKVSLLLSRYFTGLLTESLIISSIIAVVLLLFGMKVEDACFIAVIMGMLNVIPYAGPAFGVLVSIFIGIVSPIDGCTIAYTLAVICSTICVVKGIDDFVLQPTIYSSKVSAHPLEIFIVILMAGSVGGIVGLLIAVPSYTVLRVFAKEFFSEVSLVRKLTKEI
ncbi:MAG: AI-2E family transporter [Rikenellaceae bacterium]|nr:AI-2E family transporter [Rikenellaceae bacterium]